MASLVRPDGLNQNVAVRTAKHFYGPLHGHFGHLFRIGTLGKSFAKKVKVRKPPKFSVLVLTFNTLLAKVHQEQNERESNCQIRVRRGLKEVERNETHRSHSPLGGTLQVLPPVPLRVP
jgi:hypothetical protein